MHNSLELREVFHLEFLRWLGRKVKSNLYALKGGTNLRFFFNSLRYSEDMDLDVNGIAVDILKDIVMKILKAPSFQDTLRPFGIERVAPPDVGRAKQTETTQRFKVHLMTFSGEDLFTKVEFSRRGFAGDIAVQGVSDYVLRAYKLPPLLVPHYGIRSAVAQKVKALSTRAVVQARDIFDIYVLSSQYEASGAAKAHLSLNKAVSTKAHERVFEVNFEQFRDTVISYLSGEDRKTYDSGSSWDEIKLKTANFIEKL